MVGWLGAMPQGIAALGQMETMHEPFVWGAGGSRMTPEEIAFQRRLAAGQQQMDYSPVGHWTQGLARVADNVGGALREKRADKAAGVNAAEADAVMRSLMAPPQEGAALGAGDPVTAALLNPNLPENVRDFAKMQWEVKNRKPSAPTEFERELQAAGIMPGTPGYAEAMQKRVTMKTDPEVIVPLPGGMGTYVGPRSGLSAIMEGGGPPVSGAEGTPVSPASQAPSQGGYADFSSAGQLIQSMGPKGFLGWQKRHGTPVMVRSPEEMASLPPGTEVISPDGRTGVKK